ncbi:hypothetical protein D3C85_1628240 [compost metagenome]
MRLTQVRDLDPILSLNAYHDMMFKDLPSGWSSSVTKEVKRCVIPIKQHSSDSNRLRFLFHTPYDPDIKRGEIYSSCD